MHFFRLFFRYRCLFTVLFEFACEIFCYEKTVIFFTGVNLLGGETFFDVDVFLPYYRPWHRRNGGPSCVLCDLLQ
jgi:hypothetical protein